MNILIAGGTGFIGRYLVAALLSEQHEVTVLSRNLKKVATVFTKQVKAITWDQLNSLNADEFDAVINLTGHNISDHYWNKKTKQLIKSSRVNATKSLAQWCTQAKNPPHIYSADGIGIYGLQATSSTLPSPLTETTPIKPTSDFLNEVGRAWEQALLPAIDADIAVTIMRFAPVLKKGEGMLKKITPIFNLGLGGPIGSGQQAFSWIHVDDLVHAIQFLLQHPSITGVINMSAPECVMQKTFAKSLANAMHRPALLPTPAWMLKLLFGQMAEELLLAGQNVYPARLLENGYSFLYPTLNLALQHDWH